MTWRWLRAVVERAGHGVLVVFSLAAAVTLAAAIIMTFGANDERSWATVVFVVGALTAYLAGGVFGFGGLGEREGRHRHLRRVMAMRRWAQGRDWQLDVLSDDRTLPGRGFPFALGGVHSVRESAGGGHRGRDALVVYYTVATSEAPNALQYDFTIVAVGADADFPVTVAHPRRGASLLKDLIGLESVKVESADFDRRWRVVGIDTRAAHAILEPRVIERLTAPGASHRAITWDSNAIMTVRDGCVVNWTEIERELDLLADLALLVPRYMAREGGSTAGLSRMTVGFRTMEAPTLELAAGAWWLWLVGCLIIPSSLFLTLLGNAAYPLACAGLGFCVFLSGFWWDWRSRGRRRRAWAEKVSARG